MKFALCLIPALFVVSNVYAIECVRVSPDRMAFLHGTKQAQMTERSEKSDSEKSELNSLQTTVSFKSQDGRVTKSCQLGALNESGEGTCWIEGGFNGAGDEPVLMIRVTSNSEEHPHLYQYRRPHVITAIGSGLEEEVLFQCNVQ